MGNSGSQAGAGGGGGGDGRRGWAHSYPRPAHKVLPERVPGQRLRLTHNGNILHSGGTLTGRKHGNMQGRPRSSSQGSQYEPTKVLYGSEPDLRFTGRDFQSYDSHSPAKLRISRTRKKYKAPPAPHHTNGMDSSSPDSYQHWEMSGSGAEVVPPVRRLRLFKTKAESNKRKGGGGDDPRPPSHPHPLPPPGPLQRSFSSPQFQVISPAELLEAAEKLRPVREPPVGKAADSPPLCLRGRENYGKHGNHNDVIKPNNVQRTPRIPKDELLSKGRSRPGQRLRGDGGGERRGRGEGSPTKGPTPEPPRRHNHEKRADKAWPEITPTTKPTAPVKTFYFGMNEDDLLNTSSGAGSEDNPEVERFAASIQRRVPSTPTPPANLLPTHNTSGSDSLSSDPIGEESSPQISLQLRPILPRKQLEIPRFSPTAAWRLLAALESPPQSDGGEGEGEDDLILPPTPRRAPAPGDKSGDSGISGDASPQHQDSTHYSPHAAWTPQQDLEETSSDGGLESAPLSPETLPLAKFSPRFSLSLPRDDRLAVYTQLDKEKEDDSFQSLKKLKRSMSGALGRCGGKDTNSLPLDNNWVLSRSVPNSLNTSLQRWSSSSPSSPDQEDELSVVKQPSFSYLATGGHVMYLPEYSTPRSHRERERTPAALSLSKSCEDLSQLTPGVLRALEPKGRKKFTFQSTIRQIERRRLAEKLSKEAEQKERQRLNELEAMRRVEEEFQRKREREKADIRQQLRLYSLTQGRSAPEGVDAPPPPSTQVLSEFRQPRRDYRDYTPHRYLEEPVIETPKRSTVHPQVVYQMPKSTQVYVTPHLHSNSGSGVGSTGEGGGVSTPRSSCSDNYRRNFAQGALPHSLVSSDSEVSQPNTRPTSRNLHRSRSASPGRRSPRVVSPAEITLHLKQLRILQSESPVPMESDLAPPGATSPSTAPGTEPSSLDSSSSFQPPPPPQVPCAVPAAGVPRLGLSSLAQPFVPKPKTFRPIAFNPTPNKVAQIAM